MPRTRYRSAATTVTPQRTARWALLASLLSVCFLNFGAIRQVYLSFPDAGMGILLGTANAPEQYRVGVVRIAFWLARHLSVEKHYCLAVIDAACLLAAGFVLLRVLERTEVYRQSRVAVQWFGSAAFVVLVQFYLMWLWTPQRAETLPAALLVALMLWLWQVERGSLWRSCGVVAGLLGVALAQSLVRADVAFFLNLGVFLATLMPLGKRLSLPRALAAATSLTAALLAGGVQVYLARVVYPHASYGHVKMWQLRPNLVHGTRWPPFVLFVAPVVWMVVQVVRRRFADDAASVAFLVGGVVYAGAWVVVGKVDEVRIFLPFALGLAPLVVEMVMMRVGDVGLDELRVRSG